MEFAIERAYPRIWNGYNKYVRGGRGKKENLASSRYSGDVTRKVMAAILDSEYGITASELVEKTGYTRRQVQNVIHKSDIVTKIGGRFGNEVYGIKEQ
ncbi:hypothetical protein phiV208_47 [Vibrio phage phiV208]|nr:hypothetical protein phiV208_47 [Vibrio phage phiV208]